MADRTKRPQVGKDVASLDGMPTSATRGVNVGAPNVSAMSTVRAGSVKVSPNQVSLAGDTWTPLAQKTTGLVTVKVVDPTTRTPVIVTYDTRTGTYLDEATKTWTSPPAWISSQIRLILE